MKKILVILLGFIFSVCSVGVKAQTECSTIAELKALADGTECIYIGTGTTTYYDAYNGVVMQDTTGAILLQSTYLSEANATTVKAGMEITNVIGIFQVENTSYMTNIKIKKADIEKIEIKKEDVDVIPQLVDFDDYMSNINSYDGMAVKFENVNIRGIEGTSLSEIYSSETTNKLTVSFTNIPGCVVPARADLAGFLSADWSGKLFRVASAESMVAYAYNAINDIKVAVTQVSNKEYDLLDTFAITNVINTAESKIVYLQEETNMYNCGLRVLLESDVELKIGDKITGLSGTFEPFQNGSNQKSATFIQNKEKNVVVISSDVKSSVLSNYIYTLTDNAMQNAYLYDATLISFSGGVVAKNGDDYVYFIENENGQGEKSIVIKIANVDDLSMYEGKVCAIQGVLDVAATFPENKLTLILRSEKDFLESNVKFASLAELIAAGEPAGSSITYELTNPVLVTYKFAKGEGENTSSTYFFMAQDATAGIVVSLSDIDMENIAVGDSIVGLRGVYSNMRGLTTNILDVNEEVRKGISVKNSGNELQPKEVTFADLINDRAKYSNQVVVVRGVKNDSIFHPGTSFDPTETWEYFFTQNTDTLYYSLNSNGKPYFTFYSNMDITGVVDDRIIGLYFSIWPLSQESIIDLDAPDAVDNVNIDAKIYSQNNILFVETIENSVIEVFSISGSVIYRGVTSSNLTIVDEIEDPFVIVRINGVVFKVMIN